MENQDQNQDNEKPTLVSGSQLKPGIIDPRHLVVPTTPKNGDMFYSDGTIFKKLAAGQSNQVLTIVNGVPTYSSIPINGVTTLTGTTPTINCALGSIFSILLSGNTTYSISNAVAGEIFMVEAQQGSGTTYTNTWFSGITWVYPGASAPIQTTVSNGYTTYGFRVLTSSTFLGYLVGSN